MYTEEPFKSNANNERGLCTVLKIMIQSLSQRYILLQVDCRIIAEHNNNISMNIVAI